MRCQMIVKRLLCHLHDDDTAILGIISTMPTKMMEKLK